VVLMEVLIILSGYAAITIPVLMTFLYSGYLLLRSPYVRDVFSRTIGLKDPDPNVRLLALSLCPWIFGTAGFLSASGGIVLGLMFGLPLLLLPIGEGWSATLSLMSAGPAEESAKLLVSAILFIGLWALAKKRPVTSKGRSDVRDGMLAGFIVGCSFGLVESVLYLVIGNAGLLTDGIAYQTLDPVIWRIVLGVPIHGLYASIAAMGLGRRTWLQRIAWTGIGLSMAMFLHSMNNGVQGFIILVLERSSDLDVVMIDSIQILLIAIGSLIAAISWRSGRPAKS